MSDDIDSLYAKLEQKVLELRTGQALVARSPWMKKLHSKWFDLSGRKRALLMFLTFLMFCGGAIGGMLLFYLESVFGAWFSIAFSTFFFTFFFILCMTMRWELECGTHNQQKIIDLLINATQKHPHLNDSVAKIFDHIDDLNISKFWWYDVCALLDKIISGQPNLEQSKITLTTLLETKDIHIVKIESEMGHSHDNGSGAASRTKI